jgi:hypothetical protein
MYLIPHLESLQNDELSERFVRHEPWRGDTNHGEETRTVAREIIHHYDKESLLTQISMSKKQ